MCWKLSPDDRSPFEALSSAFNGRLQAVAGYMEVQMVLELQGNSYYDDSEFIMFLVLINGAREWVFYNNYARQDQEDKLSQVGNPLVSYACYRQACCNLCHCASIV